MKYLVALLILCSLAYGQRTNVKELNQMPYADQFAWTQSPASPASIAIGANTVTLPNGCPLGVLGAANNYYVYISGTGTPEAVKVTGGTCISGASTGTLIFTAVGTHAAGYTIASATGGWGEALVFRELINVGAELRGTPGTTFTFNGPLFISNSTRAVYNTTIDFTGTVQSCTYTGGSCINLGDPAGNPNTNSFIRVINPRIQPCAAIGDATHHYAAIEDNAQSSSIIGFRVLSRCSGGHYFHDLILNDNDQNLTLFDMKLQGDAGWGHCSTDWCSNAIYSPGGGGSFAGITHLNEADLSLSCNGNGIDDHNANNSVSITNSVIQAYAQWAVRINSGNVPVFNLYTEAGGCTNPIYGTTTQAGFIIRGTMNSVGGSGPSSINPKFVTDQVGATTYSYFLVMINSTASKSNPFFLGTSLVNAGTATSIAVKWPGTDYFSTDISTFDLLRVVGAVTTAPVGTSTIAVSTGITKGSACIALVCTFTDTNAALSPYTVTPTLSPAVSYLPGAIVLSSSQDRVGSSADYGIYNGRPGGGDGWINNTLPVGTGGGSTFAGGQNVFIDTVDELAVGSFTGPKPLMLGSAAGTYPQPTMFYNGITAGDADGLMGRLIITGARIRAGDYFTFDDATPAQTASLFLRPTARDADGAISSDQLAGAALRAGTSLSSYINHVPTNGDTSWLERLTSSLKSFKIPITTNSQFTSTLASGTAPFVITSTTPVANLTTVPTTYNHSGTQQTGVHIVIDTCTLGTSCSVTLTGSAVFTSISSYQCSATDTTSAAAVKFAPASGSTFALTGTGTDVLSYHCIGN